ncbi:MerR family transcriptional regulator [Clostridium sp. D33t1_170424_F3]|uniref:MerR family transcriptional regulator n=1 Tax=Clostridium sp. D33t1_170424_F3 TaxID=2787099 RepID=UPI0018A99689
MKTYKTAEIAKMIGIHPNTVRLYEEWGFIPKPERQKNGYRVFTDQHIAQFRLARLALQMEVLQNGLRKKIIEMVKTAAVGDFDRAITMTAEYQSQVRQEQKNAEEAIYIVQCLLAGKPQAKSSIMKRKEVSDSLGISMDALRNWEMNGLLTIKRKENGYRVYTEEDILRLKIIRVLRCANYSLESILRLLQSISVNPHADMKAVLNTPKPDDDIISACDRLILSLQTAEQNAQTILRMLQEMKKQFGKPSTIPPVF